MTDTATVPVGLSSQVQPVTLHGQHRPYSDPRELELFVTFREPHRVRYTKADGTVVHDHAIDVHYEFTSIDGSAKFQGHLRRQHLVDFFDVDVVCGLAAPLAWSFTRLSGEALSCRAGQLADARLSVSDTHSRTDALTGAVRGLATIQRIKLWKDRDSSCHCITFYSDKPSHPRDRRYREYYVADFQEALRSRDDKHRECQLGAIGRRGSAPNAVRAKTFHISSPSSWGRHRHRPARSSPDRPQAVPLDIRWLGIRFSRDAGKDPMVHTR